MTVDMQRVHMNLLLFQQMSRHPLSSPIPPCKDLVTCGGCQEEFHLDDLLLFLTHKTTCSSRHKSHVSSSSSPPPTSDAQTNTLDEGSRELTCAQCRERVKTADGLLEHMSSGFRQLLAPWYSGSGVTAVKPDAAITMDISDADGVPTHSGICKSLFAMHVGVLKVDHQTQTGVDECAKATSEVMLGQGSARHSSFAH